MKALWTIFRRDLTLLLPSRPPVDLAWAW